MNIYDLIWEIASINPFFLCVFSGPQYTEFTRIPNLVCCRRRKAGRAYHVARGRECFCVLSPMHRCYLQHARFVTFPCSSNELYFVQTRPRPCMDLLKLCRALGENSYLWIQSSLICSLPPSLPPSPFSPPDEEDIRGLGQRNLSDITATSSRQHILSKFILNKHVSVSAWLAQRV